MTTNLNKGTAFGVRRAAHKAQVLLIQHPHAGFQFPAGTVEPGEAPEESVRREAQEETGLRDLPAPVFLASRAYPAPEGYFYITAATLVYARPDVTSFDWAHFRSGLIVKLLRREEGFAQVAFEEPDQYPDPTYITYNITGWVPEAILTDTLVRRFYRIDYSRPTRPRWSVRTDNQLFTLFWAHVNHLPEIVHPQDEWIEILNNGIVM